MSENSTEEYTKKMRGRYARLKGRRARGKLLDEFIEITGWERKHANKVLLGKRRSKGLRGKRGAPRRYGTEFIRVLKTCWLAMEQPCGKRMKDMLPLWSRHLDCAEEMTTQLGKISAASIDRLLHDFKVKAGKKIRPPKPASAVKALVEVRAQSWDTTETGWTEVDTVAHCGGNMGGDFIWTLTSVEISSGWTELRAVWNRGQHASFQALESIWESQPFDLLGVDSDNGGEFLNCHLYHWLKNHGIHQTRSRPYFKNDQAYVEQKNHTHVRQFLGYERLEHPELLGGLNHLLKLWSQWRNLFCVTMKQQSKQRQGSRQIRRHEKQSRTPAQRLIDNGDLRQEDRLRLENQLSTLDPFTMRKEIRSLENAVWNHRKRLYQEQAEEQAEEHLEEPLREALALAGIPPLRSGTPARASKPTTKNQVAMVS
jgi:hypothetical protein